MKMYPNMVSTFSDNLACLTETEKEMQYSLENWKILWVNIVNNRKMKFIIIVKYHRNSNIRKDEDEIESNYLNY